MRRRRKFVKKRINKEGSAKKRRMLNMHRVDDFRYDLKQILSNMPEEDHRHPVFATIYSKASNLGINEARNYIKDKTEEEIIPEEMSEGILNLLYRYSRLR
ncbi:MAG TPA: hypothetical protein ENH28_02365 [Euryarchaeota archaeon]|nr:hypothetical protein BMS3Bbin15_01158 [archaeon BMS3Bbin15]HDL14991.1 hypothetical protein [Euryarchaeota archaeon]